MTKDNSIVVDGKRYDEVRADSLKVDHTYQRDLSEKDAKKIADNVESRLLGVLVVSRRSTGDYLVDGQTRHAGLLMANRGDLLVMVEVHTGLSIEDEARLFRDLNKKRRSPRAYDHYKAGRRGKDPVILEIDRIVKEVGLKVVKAPCARGIAAVSALQEVHRRDNLADVLGALSTWESAKGTNVGAYDAKIMRAVSYFLAENQECTADHLAGVLVKNGSPRKLLDAFEIAWEKHPRVSRNEVAAVELHKKCFGRRGVK